MATKLSPKNPLAINSAICYTKMLHNEREETRHVQSLRNLREGSQLRQ